MNLQQLYEGMKDYAQVETAHKEFIMFSVTDIGSAVEYLTRLGVKYTYNALSRRLTVFL